MEVESGHATPGRRMAAVLLLTWASAVEPATPPGGALDVTRSLLVHSDPLNGQYHPKAIPGALVTLTITVTNLGTEPVDPDTIVLTEALAAHSELFVGDLQQSGSGPVAFLDGTPSSGLAFTFSGLGSTTDDLSFSADGGAGWDYVPVAHGDGVDPLVTHLRVRTRGAMPGGEGASFRLSFRVRLK